MPLLTETEARTKWCPMVRIARREPAHADGSGPLTVVAGCNTDALGGVRVPASCLCIATDCAMWVRYGDEDRGYCGFQNA